MANWLRTRPHTIHDHIDVVRKPPNEGEVLVYSEGQFQFKQSHFFKVFGIDDTNLVDFSNGNYAKKYITADTQLNITNIPSPGRYYIEIIQDDVGHDVSLKSDNYMLTWHAVNKDIPNVAYAITVIELIYNGDSILIRTSQPYAEYGWKYSVDISLTNNSVDDGLNTVFPIRLDENNFNFDNVVYEDGRDVVITDENNNIIPFWVEKFSKSNKFAYIYVKITESVSQGSTTTIRLWYNNPGSYASLGDPKNTFILFDDFSTWSGWLVRGSGNVYQDLTRFSFPTLRKDDNNDPNGGYKYLPSTLNRDKNLRMVARTYRYDYTGGSADRIGIYDSSGNGYGVIYNHSGTNTYIGLDKRTSWNATVLGNTTLGSDPLNAVWYYQVLSVYTDHDLSRPNSVIVSVYNDDYNLVKSSTVTDSDYTIFDVVAVLGGHDYHLDWIGVFNFGAFSPTYGSEEEHNPRVVIG